MDIGVIVYAEVQLECCAYSGYVAALQELQNHASSEGPFQPQGPLIAPFRWIIMIVIQLPIKETFLHAKNGAWGLHSCNLHSGGMRAQCQCIMTGHVISEAVHTTLGCLEGCSCPIVDIGVIVYAEVQLECCAYSGYVAALQVVQNHASSEGPFQPQGPLFAPFCWKIMIVIQLTIK